MFKQPWIRKCHNIKKEIYGVNYSEKIKDDDLIDISQNIGFDDGGIEDFEDTLGRKFYGI